MDLLISMASFIATASRSFFLFFRWKASSNPSFRIRSAHEFSPEDNVLREAARIPAMNIPGNPFRNPRVFMAMSGMICERYKVN